MQKFDIFLSYKTQYREEVSKVYFALKEYGINPWIDFQEMGPGDEFIEVLPNIILDTKTFGACIGACGMGPWQDREFKAFLTLYTYEKDRRLIPIILPSAPSKIEMPLLIRPVIFADFRDKDFEQAIKELVCGIKRIKPQNIDIALKSKRIKSTSEKSLNKEIPFDIKVSNSKEKTFNFCTEENNMAKIGIDFGTNNTLIAYMDDVGEPHIFEIDRKESIPTIVYITNDQKLLFGNIAEKMYLDSKKDPKDSFRRWKLQMK